MAKTPIAASWTANSTSPYADQSYPNGDRPAAGAPTNLSIAPDDGENLIHWEADFANVDTYDVRINGTTTVTGIDGGAYLDANVTNGNAYSYEVRGVSGGVPSAWSNSVSVTSAGKIAATGTYYYVDNTGGSDANDGLSIGTAFETINHALGVVSAGDGIRIAAGTYQETGDPVGGKHNKPVTLTPITNGTVTDKIIIEPNPGDEGLVIIDGQSTHYGIFMADLSDASISHYVIRGLKFQNTRSASVGHWDLGTRSAGVIVEDCVFNVVRSDDGSNCSHVAFWGTEDWVIRNSTFSDAAEDTQGRGSGCQSYEMQRAVLYHNTFTNDNLPTGILLKNFYTVPYHTADVFLNLFQSQDNGLRVQIAGAGTPAAGFICCNNNIFDSQSVYGVAFLMEEADVYSNEMRIYNNSFYNIDIAMNVSGCESLKTRGNLTPSCNVDLQLQNSFGSRIVKLKASDYNIFDTDFDINANRFNTPFVNYNSLATWQTVTAGDNPTVDVTSPDGNSSTSTAALVYTNAVADDFTNAVGSPALGIMPDGSNAGAYRTGSEQIGAA